MHEFRRQLLVVAGLSIAILACSGADPLNQDLGLQGEDLPKGSLRTDVALEIETPDVVELPFTAATTMVARVVYTDDRSAVPDRPVTWVLGSPAAGSRLEVEQSATGSDGRAQNRLTAGDTRTSFTVTVSTLNRDGTDVTATATITVIGDYVGAVKVTYAYDDIVPVSAISTTIHEGEYNCAGVAYDDLPPVLAERVAPNPSGSVTFAGLPEDQIYTLLAVGQGPMGNAVAYGCIVAPAIVGRSDVHVTIPMGLKAASLLGVYDFGTHLALNEALPGTMGDTLSNVEDFFYNPAGVIGTFLVQAIADELGSEAAAVDLTVVTAWEIYAKFVAEPAFSPDVDVSGTIDVADVVTYLVLDDMPAWATDGLLLGGDLTSLLTELKVGGELEILTADAAGDLTATWDWSRFLWQWRVGVEGCEPTNACCGRQTFSGTEMGMTPVGADFTASVGPRSTDGQMAFDLTIDEHRLDLQYGALALFALNEFVLPATTGQDNIECAVESFFGCQEGGEFVCGAVASSSNGTPCGCARVGLELQGMFGNMAGLPGLNASVGEVACGFAVEAAAIYVRDQLQDMVWNGGEDSYMTVSGTGVISDQDFDMQTDKIVGDIIGTLTLTDGSSAFSGDLFGELTADACAAESACGSGTSCQLRSDPLDTCAARQVCMAVQGSRIAGQGCVTDGQCESGLCITVGSGARTCFAACTDDDDCPGSLICEADGTAVDLGGSQPVMVSACGI